jgi:propionyl-CoA carboxylase alpha chain
LSIANIVDACKKTGAQAVHPGYGFLSENADFSQALADNGIKFMGPDASAIHSMGDKIGSKKLAKKAGVHIIPGFLGEVNGDAEVLKVAHEIGYPVMVKASSGGGGKGMRIAWNDEELLEGYRLSKQEAAASFGSDRMLIEKFIDNPRHIEIQVLCDGQGTSLYFPERDCSVQRRNQKVIEESPSAFLDQATRDAMGKQAVALADAVGYKSAGTVEFICDPDRNFYFLEMNTRLQVEHPITEMITGVDIVEHMIDIAAGKRLRLKQSDLAINGHAFESRVYAEDPLRGYLPSIGRLVRYEEPLQPPEHLGDVRVDSGILEGSEISIFYDPLIAKLITHGETRDHALQTMTWALDNYVIGGVTNNVNLLRDLTVHPDFVAANVTTKFLPTHYKTGYHGHQLNAAEQRELQACAAVLAYRQWLVSDSIGEQLPSAGSSGDRAYVVTLPGGEPTEVHVALNVGDNGAEDDDAAAADLDYFHVRFADGTEADLVSDSPLSSTLFHAQFVGHEAEDVRTLQVAATLDEGFTIQYVGSKYDVLVRSPLEQHLSQFMPVKVKADMSNFLVSPMPGTVVSFSVKEGDTVLPHTALCVVEAMKMQNVLRAESAARIKSIKVKPGQAVAVDEVLIEFEQVDVETKD